MAGFFEWDDKYKVGISKIDEQHKKLVSLINDLHSACMVGKGSRVVGDVLRGTVEYTLMHFSTEEEFMRSYDYPEYRSHKSIHDNLAKQAKELLEKSVKNKLTVSLEVMNFLKSWLQHHIGEDDRKLGAFLIGKGLQ